MSKKNKLVIVVATAIFVFTACNDATTSATADTKMTDTAMAANMDTAQNDVKMDNVDNVDNGMMGKMTSMMDKMKSTKLTGDFDLDFIALMTEHHQGAVEISEMAVSTASDPQIKTMAQNMITDHKSEIADLNAFMKSHDTSSAEHKKASAPGHSHEGKDHKELSEHLNGMMDKTKGLTMTGNADKDYVMLMTAHHESAIDLSEDELSHGHHTALKKMAKKMISDDKKEIEELKKWLAANK